MGVVYAAFDRTRGHDVALKRLLVEKFKQPSELVRATALFEREYHTLSQLAHPQIISVYDYGLDEEGPYYTMERLSGDSLRARAPLPWVEACSLIRDIASALAIVHSRRLVHRDVTPLNIHCPPEGGAKLIDFGAMMPTGVAKQVVGTPAFIAPECLQLQSLDGQTDLYSLGGCLYFVLTGQHAYPARNVEALRYIWQNPPPSVSRLVPDVPEALDELVLSLLNLQPSGRPRTAAEVYERLSAIADLPRNERIGAAQAYLTKPALVGRESELAALRYRAQRATDGHGASVLIQSVAGLGRSRLLDAAVLEAKLCGLFVVRADASEGQSASLGVIRHLLAGLVDGNTQLQTMIDELSLSAVLNGDTAAVLENERRDRTLGDITGVFLAACQRQTCAIIVDDLQQIDEPSLAFLAGLSMQVRTQRLLIVTSVDTSAAVHAAGAQTLLAESSKRLVLAPLDAAASRMLLASIFGEVPNVDVLSAVAHRRCQGNPRMLMEAAQALIDRGLVRYEGGSWLISSDPEAVATAIDDQSDLEQHLQRLSDDARELLEVLALDRNAIMSFADYPQLLRHADGARMNRAVTDLVKAGWVVMLDDRASFSRDDQRRAVAARISLENSREIHRRLAERCAVLPLPRIYETHHWIGAGDALRALTALDAFGKVVENQKNADILRQPITLETLEQVSLFPDFVGAHPAARANHAAIAIINAAYRGLPERIVDRLGGTLAELAPFTGMSDYQLLADLEPTERLTQALTRAQARCNHPGPGGFDVIGAIRRQTQMCITAAATANFMSDPSLFALIPDLAPFSVLSPALAVATRIIDGLSKLTRGKFWQAWDIMYIAHAEMRGPLGAQLDQLTLLAIDRVALGYVCALSAEHGASGTLELIEQYAPLMPNLAESHRARYCLALGDLAGAEAARRRFEVLSVQVGGLADARVLELPGLLALYALCDDVMGLRRTRDAIQDVARTRPRWKSRAELARAHVLRCQGNVSAALSVIERSLTELQCEDCDWQPSAAAHLDLLNLSARHAEAEQLGNRYLEQARAIGVPTYRLELALARATAELSNPELAERHLASALSALEARGAGGVLIGHVYEVGARLALSRRDRDLFTERVRACAERMPLGKNPSLTARYNKLLREATRAGLRVEPSRLDPLGRTINREDSRIEALRELAFQSVDDSTFYGKVLELLVDFSGAIGGFLYAGPGTQPGRVATFGGIETQCPLDEVVAKFYGSSNSTDVETTSVTASIGEAAGDANTLFTTSGNAMMLYVLEHVRLGSRTVQGVAVLDPGSSVGRLPSASLAAIASILADRAELRTAAEPAEETRFEHSA